MNAYNLKELEKNEIPTLAKKLSATDIDFLVQMLNEKDDKLRYNAFLLLQSNSREFPFVYEYWSEFEKKLESSNSYQRSLGVMLISENVIWDKHGRFTDTINKYLHCCNDEKFITARQTIQGLEAVLKATDKFDNLIRQNLSDLRFSQYKENQQRLLDKDRDNILGIIEKKSKPAK